EPSTRMPIVDQILPSSTESLDEPSTLPSGAPVLPDVNQEILEPTPRANLDRNIEKNWLELESYVFNPIMAPEAPSLSVTDPVAVALSNKLTRFRWGLDLETNLGIGSNHLNGFGGGPYFSVQFSNGLQVETSLHYYYVRTSGNFLARAFEMSNDESNSAPINAGDTSSILFEPLTPGISNNVQVGQLPFEDAGSLFDAAHILNIQMGLGYQFHRKWSVHSSMGISKYFIPGDQELFGETTAFNSTNFMDRQDLINRLAFDLSGQIRYHFSPHISWSLGYRIGFNDLTRNSFQQEALKESLSGLRTGIRFGF
ncbi:MAG: autotransporter outer membrane beta-barrel domain-containing protein, partial [Bacteroidota bacterium]